jgi:hypothetical protein
MSISITNLPSILAFFCYVIFFLSKFCVLNKEEGGEKLLPQKNFQSAKQNVKG